MYVDDFDIQLDVVGLTPTQNAEIQAELEQLLDAAKPRILANLPTVISEAARSRLNAAAETNLPREQLKSPCTVSSVARHLNLTSLINTSRVCVSNNAAFVLTWAFQNCPAGVHSAETHTYPIDQTVCADVTDLLPGSIPGATLRVEAKAIAGLRQLTDPALAYQPGSNVAGFECSGTTLDYNCKLISVAPLDPNVLPTAQKICVINHAGFVMSWSAKDTRLGADVAHTERYPIDQKRCIDLGSYANTTKVATGDVFEVEVNAVLGKKLSAARKIRFANNGLTTSFECKGTTLHYSCKLLQ